MNSPTDTSTATKLVPLNVRGFLAWTIHDVAAALARVAHRLDEDAPTMSGLWRDGYGVGHRR